MAWHSLERKTTTTNIENQMDSTHSGTFCFTANFLHSIIYIHFASNAFVLSCSICRFILFSVLLFTLEINYVTLTYMYMNFVFESNNTWWWETYLRIQSANCNFAILLLNTNFVLINFSKQTPITNAILYFVHIWNCFFLYLIRIAKKSTSQYHNGFYFYKINLEIRPIIICWILHATLMISFLIFFLLCS